MTWSGPATVTTGGVDIARHEDGLVRRSSDGIGGDHMQRVVAHGERHRRDRELLLVRARACFERRIDAAAFTDTRLTSVTVPVMVVVDGFRQRAVEREMMVTAGALRSTVISGCAVVVLPAASLMTTANVCGPSDRPVIEASQRRL